MILYHFTRPEFVEAILREGLKANDGREYEDDKASNGAMANFERVVWLTVRDDNTMSLRERKRMLSQGILCGPKTRQLPEATVSLRLEGATLQFDPQLEADLLAGRAGPTEYVKQQSQGALLLEQ